MMWRCCNQTRNLLFADLPHHLRPCLGPRLIHFPSLACTNPIVYFLNFELPQPTYLKYKNFLFLRCGEFLLQTKSILSYLCWKYMAGRAALSITTKSHEDRHSKSMSGQGIPPHRLKDDRLPLPVIMNNQKYSPFSSAAVSPTCSKTWDGGGFAATNRSFR